MYRMEQVSLMELAKLAAEGQVEAEAFAQVAQCAQKMTKSNKPYLDVTFADAEGTMGLKVWEDKPWFRTLAALPLRSFVSLRGQWTKGGFGMEAAGLEVRPLDEQEKESFLAGSDGICAEAKRLVYPFDTAAGYADSQHMGNGAAETGV